MTSTTVCLCAWCFTGVAARASKIAAAASTITARCARCACARRGRCSCWRLWPPGLRSGSARPRRSKGVRERKDRGAGSCLHPAFAFALRCVIMGHPGRKELQSQWSKCFLSATAGFSVQNEKSQIVLNTSINSISCVPFSILPMIYQYFWRVRLAKPE